MDDADEPLLWLDAEPLEALDSLLNELVDDRLDDADETLDGLLLLGDEPLEEDSLDELALELDDDRLELELDPNGSIGRDS